MFRRGQDVMDRASQEGPGQRTAQLDEASRQESAEFAQVAASMNLACTCIYIYIYRERAIAKHD